MKILCVIDSLGPGGAQRQLVTLAKLWKQKGHEIRFLTYYRSDFFLPELLEQGIEVHTLQARSYLERIYKMRKYIRREKQDVVLSFLDTPNFLCCFSAVGGKKWRLIISERSNKESHFKGVKFKIQKYFARYADAIVCNSNSARQVWKKFYPSYISKLKTIYNTVLLPPVQARYSPWKDGKLHVLVAASYRQLKNMDGLIEGINLLSEEEKEKLEINWYGSKYAGDKNGSAYQRAEEKKHRYHLDSVIHFHEETGDIYTRMSQADCIGLFSKWEGLPNTICEAMQLGKPVVMTKVSDYETLIDSDNGFLCDGNDPSDIRDAFRNLLHTNGQQLKKMGEASRNKAERLFDIPVILEKWDQLFKI